MTNHSNDWFGRPLQSQNSRGSDTKDAALIERLEAIKKPAPQDRGALAALRTRTPSGSSVDTRVWSLTQRWNELFAEAKAAVEESGKPTADDGPTFLR